jgi:hypothetical protein
MTVAKSGGIFVSYRRQETNHLAGRLADRLADRFGERQVFMDVDAIQPGLDFAEEIFRAVTACQVLLAIIGPDWLTITDERGRRRLDDRDDIVRLEIEAALARGVRVIPILVEGAVMPGRDDLPDTLASLARRQALSLRHESFRSDTGRLVTAIEPILAPAPSPVADAERLADSNTDEFLKASFDDVWEYVQTHQADLRSLAWSTSPPAWKSDIVPMLIRPGWLGNEPIPLENVSLELQTGFVTDQGRARGLINLQPSRNSFGGHQTYSKALTVRAGQDGLFNGLVYRPLNVEVSQGGFQLTFTEGRYFDYLDSSEVLAYELGARVLAHELYPAEGVLRRSIADPFNLALRATSLGVNTLTIRKDARGKHGFFMHKRSGSYVVNERGLIHVIPAGEFTPSNVAYEAVNDDFSIWLNVMREYAEEFLNKEESYGRGGKPLDYENDSPYAELSAARRRGALHISIFGIAIDPLCLKPELLTVCIFEAKDFDRIFAKMVTFNSEGVLLVGPNRMGIPFTEPNIKLYADNADTASAGAACLKLAWRHRRELGLESN